MGKRKKQKEGNKGSEIMKKHEEIIAWIKKKRFGISHHIGMVGKIDRTF